MTPVAAFQRCAAALVIAGFLSSCGTIDAESELSKKLAARGFDHPEFNGSFLPEGSFHLSSSYSVTYADAMLVAGALVLIYLVVDPLAPNWEIVEKRWPDGRLQYSLRMKNFHTGGDGEARLVLARRAAEYAREAGMAGYEIRAYSESIDSRLWLPHRTAEAVVAMLPPAVPPQLSPAEAARPPLQTF
ncbi:MAG TPA: hypothetical protein VLC92_12095 [Rhodocyclaceae bacterium]|nr:hypothetical protein [Rhodocyclaceae bacterium]